MAEEYWPNKAWPNSLDQSGYPNLSISHCHGIQLSEPLAPLPRLSNFQVELITFQRPKCYANASIRRVLRVLATLIWQFFLTCSSDDKSRGSGGLCLSRMAIFDLFELADPTVVVVPADIVVVVMVIVVADTKMFPEQEEAEPPDA